jgi:hypothetical protein
MWQALRRAMGRLRWPRRETLSADTFAGIEPDDLAG